MPDQRVDVDAGSEALDGPPTSGAEDRLVTVALYVFFIALLLLVGAMTLLPVVLR